MPRTRSKKQNAPPAGRPTPHWIPPDPSLGHARAFDIFAACAPGAGGRRNPMGRGPARGGGGGGVFCCGCAARFFLLRVHGKFTHSLAARRLRESTAERNPGSGAPFFCCGCASSLTHSLPAARSTRSKKKHGFHYRGLNNQNRVLGPIIP